MIIIRSASENDIAQLTVLFEKSCESQMRFNQEVKLSAEIDWKAFIFQQLESKNAEILVAENNSDIVGFIRFRLVHPQNAQHAGRLKMIMRKLLNRQTRNHVSIYLPRRYGYIDDIYVVPSLQRSPVGVGVKLYRSSIDWFKLHQVHDIEGIISVENEGSMNFFDKLGYEPVRVLMRKRI